MLFLLEHNLVISRGSPFASILNAMQSNPLISITQGEQKLVRYSEGSLYPNVYQGKSNQREMKIVQYSGDSLYPVFDTAEFDCSGVLRVLNFQDLIER